MGRLYKIQILFFTVIFSLILVGCGGGTDTFGGGNAADDTGDGTGNGGGDGVPGSGSQLGAPASIVLSFPYTNSITNLGGGFYRRVGRAIVTDVDGNIVADGTQVTLKIIDSIKAQGVIVTGDADGITGTVLTDTGPMLGSGAPTSFDAANVYRGGGYRFIEPEDQVFLFNADKADLVRSVASGALAATTLNVTSAYANTYPNVTYASNTTSYAVGASHLGAEVAGVDASGTLTTGIGSSIDGIVDFAVTYPASTDTLNVGCINPPLIDTRLSTQPVGSAFVLLGASVVGADVSVVDNRFCFAPIAGGTLTASVAEISGSTTIGLQYRDGGDSVPVPFSGVSGTVLSKGAVVTLDAGGIYTTNEFGWVTSIVTVSGAPASTATITYTAAPGVTAEVIVTLPP